MTAALLAPRIACVQHGDYWQALQHLSRGGAETYGHQADTVASFERLVSGVPRLVVSLDAPAYYRQCGDSVYAGLPMRAARWLPGRWTARQRAVEVIALLERFRPSHLLLRACDVVGCRVLDWANGRRLPTAVMIAARFDAAHAPNREFCELANQDNVAFVGNHNRVATSSLIACGLHADKAIAWDYAPTATPEQFPPKLSPEAGDLTMVYAGAVIEAKGVAELVDAVAQARDHTALPLKLVICGDGDLRARLMRHPGFALGWLDAPGLLPSGEVMERMRQSWVVVVPSRPGYPEALPLVITEALTTRTPVLMSDHPIFREYFRDGEGVRFFTAGDAGALARLITELAAAPAAYVELSRRTASVWHGLQLETRFDHLLERFARHAGLPSSPAQAGGIGARFAAAM